MCNHFKKTLPIRLWNYNTMPLILLVKTRIMEASPEIVHTLFLLNKLCNVTPCLSYSFIKMCNVKLFNYPQKSTCVDNLTIHDENKIFGPRFGSLKNTPVLQGNSYRRKEDGLILHIPQF